MSVKVRNVLTAVETLSEMFCRIQRFSKDEQLNVVGDAVPESMRAMIPAEMGSVGVDAAWKRGPERADIYPGLNPNEINDAVISTVDVIVCSNAGIANPLQLTILALLNGIGQARNERDQFRQTIEQLSQENQKLQAKIAAPSPEALGDQSPTGKWPPRAEAAVSQPEPVASA